jgi:hypothetical protein
MSRYLVEFSGSIEVEAECELEAECNAASECSLDNCRAELVGGEDGEE